MKLSPAAARAIAAEYALGTLRGRARGRFEALMRADPALAEETRGWELQLAGLAARAPAVEPPARVWSRIESRIAPREAGGRAFAGLWRALGITAAGLASVLLVFFAWFFSAPRGEPAFVAVLAAQDSVPRMVVSTGAPGVLRVQVVKPWADVSGKSLELWALPKDGAPRSLGLVANGGETTIRIAAGDARMQGANALAVSLEPAGGSPTRQPTGPVLCSGAIAAVRRT